MNSGIPFVKIANRVEVTVKLKAVRVSGPPVDLKKIANSFSCMVIHQALIALSQGLSGRA
jgi:hypothetical protein